jgi:hypothetical protein
VAENHYNTEVKNALTVVTRWILVINIVPLVPNSIPQKNYISKTYSMNFSGACLPMTAD